MACLGTSAFLLIGNLWGVSSFGYWTLMVLYMLMGLSIILTAAITPTLGEFSKAVRSAEREGRAGPSPWSDAGLNRPALGIICLIVLAAPTIVWTVVETPMDAMRRPEPLSYSLPIAIGVLAVAAFGLGWQFFQIRFGKRAGVFMALFLLSTWLFPVVFGSILTATTFRGNESILGMALMATSPLAGVAMSSGIGRFNEPRVIQAAALMPTLAAFFLFNNLVTAARRRVIRRVRAPSPSKEVPA